MNYSHEEIVATALYFIDRDEDIVGGDILFKRAFFLDEAQEIFLEVPQMRPQMVDEIIERDGVLLLGKAESAPKDYWFSRIAMFTKSQRLGMSITTKVTPSRRDALLHSSLSILRSASCLQGKCQFNKRVLVAV